MSATIWDAAMASVAARIRAQITDVTLDVDRRAAVAEGQRPRLVMQLGRTIGDPGMSPQATFHGIEVVITCHAEGATDTAARVALNTLRARLIAALDGWRDGVIFDVQAGDAALEMLDVSESAKPAGMLSQPFTVSAVTPTASPYA
jgi:hypothetical protein